MALSFLIPNRTVLLIADEALYIYSSGAKGVKLIETVPWDAEGFEKNVAGIIAKECGKKPVLVLNDMVEQHYRKEKVLKKGVGVLDKAGLIKRKLNIVFSNYPVKAAYPLKEKLVKSEGGLASDIYIFAAVPDSIQFTKTMSAARDSLASIAGFCLLPVESSDMIKTLAAKLSKNKKDKPKWALFMGQHKNGSLRQVVTKNGELALTRMTPILDDDSNPEEWAAEVHQEFKATMSYLSRFGFQTEDGLDVMLVANPSGGEALGSLIEEDCKYHSITVAEAAQMLGVPIGRQEDMRYADPLHIAWTGAKNQFILPMKAAQIDKVSKPRQVAMLASLLLFLGSAFLGYQFMDQYQALATIHNDIDDARSRQAQLDVQYQKEVQRKEELGFDVRLVQSSIAVKEELKDNEMHALNLFKGLGYSLGKDMRIDQVEVRREGKRVEVKYGVEKITPGPVFRAQFQMTYPSTTDVEAGNQEVRDLRDRLQNSLPGHEVKVTKFLKDYEYVEQIVVETGDLDRQDVQQDFVAEIKIIGPLLGEKKSL